MQTEKKTCGENEKISKYFLKKKMVCCKVFEIRQLRRSFAIGNCQFYGVLLLLGTVFTLNAVRVQTLTALK